MNKPGPNWLPEIPSRKPDYISSKVQENGGKRFTPSYENDKREDKKEDKREDKERTKDLVLPPINLKRFAKDEALTDTTEAKAMEYKKKMKDEAAQLKSLFTLY